MDTKKYYLIIWDEDWADIFGFDVIEEELYNDIITVFDNANDPEFFNEDYQIDELSDILYDALHCEYCFGTNEERYFESEDIERILRDAISIDENEFNVLNKFFGKSYTLGYCKMDVGLSFTDNVIERLKADNLLK